jgi:hypothetical protein
MTYYLRPWLSVVPPAVAAADTFETLSDAAAAKPSAAI